MHRFVTIAGLALVAMALLAVSPASAQFIQVYYPPVVAAPAPVVSYSYYAPAPVYYSPAPAVSYYAPAPAVSYYPTTVYSPPVAYSVPGTVTTRSFVGLGIFRPRGVYTQSYYTPGVTYSSYYAPAFYR